MSDAVCFAVYCILYIYMPMFQVLRPLVLTSRFQAMSLSMASRSMPTL